MQSMTRINTGCVCVLASLALLIGCQLDSSPQTTNAQAAPSPTTAVRPMVKVDKFGDAVVKTTESRRNFIARELSRTPEHLWAGHYYAGDGLAMNQRLTAAPISGFAFTWHGNLGLYDHNHGDIHIVGDRLFLLPELQTDSRVGGELPRELYPVTWGSRMYLIAKTELDDFVNAVNLGREPRRQLHGLFLLRGDDYTKVAQGQPRLPGTHLKKLLAEEITGNITAVFAPESDDSDAWTVEINLGQQAGVWRGMELCLADSTYTITVTKVSDHTSEATYSMTPIASVLPEVGMAVRSRFPFAK